MAARSGQKLKQFYIIDILREYSDDNHPLNATEICEKLAGLGVTAERKSIYSDIENLINYGFDIIKTGTPKKGFFLGERDFELPEIYLLADAVKTAKFISPKKSRKLVSKLENMLSVYNRAEKQYGIYIDKSIKTKNEDIFYSIDTIFEAIKKGKQISFKYGVRELSGDRKIITTYKQHTVTPYAMTWQDDHYYLICNKDKYDNLMHTRIDRMKSVAITSVPARPIKELPPYKDTFDVGDYTRRLFGMFGGEISEVTLVCSRNILEQITDRFGEDIFIRDVNEKTFTFSAKMAISAALVTFIINYGSDVTVKSPEKLRDMVIKRAEEISGIYK